MSHRSWVYYDTCDQDCKRLAELECEAADLRQQVATFAIAAEILASLCGSPVRIVERHYGPEVYGPDYQWVAMAAAYAIAEEYGEDWWDAFDEEPVAA